MQSWGYKGTIDEAQWAQMAAFFGTRYAVRSNSDWDITAVVNERQISISPGLGFGNGVADSTDEAVVLALPAPPATVGQWYLLVARRDWGDSSTEFVLVSGDGSDGTTPTAWPTSYPAAREASPGVLDDQPLFWAWVKTSSTDVVLFDLRTYAIGDTFEAIPVWIADGIAAEDISGQIATEVAGYPAVVDAAAVATAEQVAPALAAELPRQLPSALESELPRQLPLALESELPRQLPPALASELVVQLPPALASELVVQLPAAVSAELAADSTIVAAGVSAVDGAIAGVADINNAVIASALRDDGESKTQLFTTIDHKMTSTSEMAQATRHARAYAISEAQFIAPAVNASVQVLSLTGGLRYRMSAEIIVGAAGGGAFGSTVAMVGMGNAGLASFRGIGVDTQTNRPAYYDGAVVSLSSTPLPAGVYYAQVITDEESYSLVIRSADGISEYRTTMPKPAVPTSAMYYWTGAEATVRTIAVNPSSATITPRSVAASSPTVSYSETWADKAGWSAGSPQVSAGRLYAGPSTPVYLERPIPTDYATHVITTTLDVVPGGSAGAELVGVDCGSATNSTMVAIGVAVGTAGVVLWHGTGVGGAGGFAAVGPAPAAGIATIRVEISATELILEFTDSGAVLTTVTVLRSDLTSQPVDTRVWLSDSGRALSGASVGALSTSTVVDIAAETHEGGTEGIVFLKPDMGLSSRIRIEFPADYASDKPAPAVIYCHGTNRNSASGHDDFQVILLTNGLTKRGYIVVHIDASANGWGNEPSLTDYVNAYEYLRDHYAISGTFLVSQSMGGLAGLTIIGRRLFPVLGWFGVDPVTNLRDMYDRGQFTNVINLAYGIAADGSDYEAQTTGYDPNLRPATDFVGVPMRVITSADDSVVPPSTNAEVLLARVQSVVSEASLNPIPGTSHIGNASFDPADADAFFKRCMTY